MVTLIKATAHRIGSRNDALGYETDITLLQGGLDVQHDSNKGTLITGLTVGYSLSDIEFDDSTQGDIKAWMVGGYASWFHQQGWYLDLLGLYLRHDYAVNSSDRRADYDSHGLQGSVEGGYSYVMGEDLIITPQAQFTWSNQKLGNFTDSLGANVSDGKSNSRQLRLALEVEKTVKMANQQQFLPYVRISLTRELDGESNIYMPDPLEDDASGTRYRVDAGFTMNIDEESYIYTTFGYSHSISGRDSRSYDGQLGIRWQW